MKGLLLLLSGCGCWVFIRSRVDICPKCNYSPFRSVHLLECNAFWGNEDLYEFMRSAAFNNELHKVGEKLLELLAFWSEVVRFNWS